MNFIYILSNTTRIVKATKSLDERTLWEANGGLAVEVPLSLAEDLASYIDDNQEVYIQNEEGERLAEVKPEIYNDPIEHQAHDCSASYYTPNYVVGRVIVNGQLIESLNLTKDLVTEITTNCEELAQNEQNEIN
jgi:hypothetical protein